MLEETMLRYLYLEQRLSIRAIASLKKVPTRVVYDGLMNHRIPRRSARYHPTVPSVDTLPDEATLRQWYLDKRLSIREISNLANLSIRSVHEALIQYRIPRRHVGRSKLPKSSITGVGGVLNETTMRNLYEIEGRSIATIATLLDCSKSSVRNALVQWDIPRRKRGQKREQFDSYY